MTDSEKELLERILRQQENLMHYQRAIVKRLEVLETIVGVSSPPIERVQKAKPSSSTQASDNGTTIPPRQTQPEPVTREVQSPTRKAQPKTAIKRESLEFQIGGTLLNRVGAVAIILGLSFFLKYSFDNQWIGPTGRVIMGILAGLALLVVGERLRKKYFVYSQGLVGAGSLALYFSVYASYNFYHLINPALAFIFLIVVMANTVFTSVRHNSITVGILGIVGGYAAPILISTGTPLPWVFFGYLTILTCGILGVSMYKRWNLFRLISFVFNQILLAIWCFDIYNENHLVPTFIFVAFNLLAYLTIATGFNIKIKSIINSSEAALVALNAIAFFAWSKLLLEETFLKDYLGFYTLGLALLYIYIGRLAYRLHSEDKKQVYILFAVAVKLITVAIFLQLDYKYIAYGWMLEAFGIFFITSQLKNRVAVVAGLIVLGLATAGIPCWVDKDYVAVSWLGEALGIFLMGIRLNIPEARYSGVAALALGSLTALEGALGWNLFDSEKFLLNWATCVLVLSILFAGVIYFFYKSVKDEREKLIRIGVGIGILALLFAFLSLENRHFFLLYQFQFFLSPEQLSLSILWIIYAVFLFLGGLKKNIKGLRYAALALIGIIIVKAFLVDLANLEMIFKILLFIILGLFLLGISFMYQKKRNFFDGGSSM